MTLRAIRLCWFRGAAEIVSLDLDGKSAVIYGANASGKSCFVDAVEYALTDGRIGHLAHVYSGRRQEKAVINTHKPEDQEAFFEIEFEDASVLRSVIENDGAHTFSGAVKPDWEPGRTILRQHEVARFIHSTKGDKYSTLLPVLGLRPLELAAENLRQVARAVEQKADVDLNRARVTEAERKKTSVIGPKNDDEVADVVRSLHVEYCGAQRAEEETSEEEGAVPRGTTPGDVLLLGSEAREAIDGRLAELTRYQRTYAALQDAAAEDLRSNIAAVRETSAVLADATEPLVAEKLRVLESADAFTSRLTEDGDVTCPACGQSIPVQSFRQHIEAEKTRLKEIRSAFDSRRTTVAALCGVVKALQVCFAKPILETWKTQSPATGLSEQFEHLEVLDTDLLSGSCDEEDLKSLESELQPLIVAAAAATADAPLEAKKLSDDRRTIDAAHDFLAAKETTEHLELTEALLSYVVELEQGVRDQIRQQAQAVVSDLSSDIQSMWLALYPQMAIEDVRLHLPEADKAIEIHLKFHGKDLESPTIALSEGCRNGLGLCIFLAQAKRETGGARPLFLDDVAISFDREHRGMIAGLLEQEFGSRQVVILTHDREWFAELRTQLPERTWAFRVLLPYDKPEVGICWSHKCSTFDEARARLTDWPDAAGNEVRKMMDVELALIAEKLQSRLPFRRGIKNDLRTSHEFTARLAADAKKCFQTRCDSDYCVYTDAVQAIEEAGRLLKSWGNRGSHSTSLTRSEATRLLDSCEEALEYFQCRSCSAKVWRLHDASKKLLQCGCGGLRWRYGEV